MLSYAGLLVPVALVDGAGNAQGRQVVDVLNVDGTTATVYADAARTALTGAVASDATGNVSGVYAEPGVYRLRFSVLGVSYEVQTVASIDPREITDLHTLVTGNSGSVSAETTARTAADSAESSARAAADSAEAALRASGDTNETNTRAAADAAEAALRASLAATEAADAAAAATANGNEVTARAAAVLAEQNRALAAEAANAASIASNTSAVALKAPLASPALTGTPTVNGAPVETTTHAAGAYLPFINGAKYHLLAQGAALTSATDITTILNAVIALGYRHITVPWKATPWPMLTTFTYAGAEKLTIEFERGAQVAFNMPGNARGMDLTRTTLIDPDCTSTAFSVPSSSADAVSAAYGLPAREVLLRDDCHLRGQARIEYATTGFHFIGKNCSYERIFAKNIRHRTGWGSAVHFDGSTGTGTYAITGQWIHAEDCDRGVETEDGAHDISHSGGGYLKNIYPNGYTGQPTDTSGPDAAVYANYTFVIDAHAHLGSGGVQNIVYDGDWLLENCGAAVTFIRSSGSNDADLPRNCRAGNIHIKGRGLAPGYETIALQGHNHEVGNVLIEAGAGFTGGAGGNLVRVRVYTGSTGCRVGGVRAEAFTLPLVQVDSGATDTKIGQVIPADGVANGTTGWLVDIAGARTVIDGLSAQAVGGTLGYLRLQATATESRVKQFDYSLKAGETFTDPLLNLAANSQIGRYSAPTLLRSIAAGNFVVLDDNKSVGTSATLGNGTLRLLPFYVPFPITFDQIGGEITVVGEAGSVVRLALYTDAGNGLPGTVLVDTTIPGDAVAVPPGTLATPVTLKPGWYWRGGAVQGAPTTQPTVRTTSGATGGYPILGTTAAGVIQSAQVGHAKGSVSGALPAFGTTPSPTTTAPRLWVRVATPA